MEDIKFSEIIKGIMSILIIIYLVYIFKRAKKKAYLNYIKNQAQIELDIEEEKEKIKKEEKKQ